jgi:hypothetical protein
MSGAYSFGKSAFGDRAFSSLIDNHQRVWQAFGLRPGGIDGQDRMERTEF